MTTDIKTKAGRSRLAPKREPYWERLEKGLHLGYRSLDDGTGTWIARRTEQRKKRHHALGAQPSFDGAKRAAEQWAGRVHAGVSEKPPTVEDACRHYVAAIRAEKGAKTAADAEGRFKRLVYGRPLGAKPLDKLNTLSVREWRDGLVGNFHEDDQVRRSKDSANRNLATLKAALNRAHVDRLTNSDDAWETVLAFPDVGRRRTAYLSKEERNRLIACSPVDLGALIIGLLLTALRPGELAAATVADFDKGRGTLAIRHSKAEVRVVPLSSAALEHFLRVTKDRIAAAPLVPDAYGRHWNKDAWKKPFRLACVAAGLPESVCAYTLRHVAITELIASGMDSHLVAKIAGTSTAMIDSNYSHLRVENTRAMMDRAAML